MKRLDKEHERLLSELDRRKMKRRKDSDEFKVVEGVIDPPTLKALYKLLNKGTISALHGVISTGKEANVYRGEDSDGNPVAVKIYRVSTAETDFMLEYIVGDPRFKRIKKRSRALIPQWALKEYKNLTRFHEAGVRVPEPLDIQRNVLVMEFIGDPKSSVSAPMIKNVEIPSPVKTFNQLLRMVTDGYTKAGLVHADLSEYNILWFKGPVIIDVSQAVLKTHDNAKRYLIRDIQNITSFFRKLGVESETPEKIAEHILASGEE
ncbi:MAG: serine protein kinase RIO [Candidatus Thorarchaeota archaeon]|nr:MAG: serine protein kinase RIO [Candidatus Thorarchaeota archaeon]